MLIDSDKRKLIFTDYGTVKFDQKEIPIDELFKRLEHDVDPLNSERNTRYKVRYYDDTKRFVILRGSVSYYVTLNNHLEDSLKSGGMDPIVRHLMSLSRINDIAEGNGQNLALSEYDKEVYLRGLKSGGFTVKRYLKNYFEDLRRSIHYVFHLTGEDRIAAIAILIILSIIGSAASVIIASVCKDAIFLLGSLTGAALTVADLAWIFVREQTRYRFSRLKRAVKGHKLRKTRIKNLEQSLKSEEIEEVEKLEEIDIKSEIPKMINHLIEMLGTVSCENRGTLPAEVRQVLTKYQKMIAEDPKSDNRIALENNELLQEIADLEIRIITASRVKGGRGNEIEYLQKRLDALEAKPEEQGSIQKVHQMGKMN